MSILYCHDNIYQKCEDGIVYSPGQFPAEYWSTFLNHFDNLIVTGREGPLSKSISKLNVSSRENVTFVLFPNINTLIGRIRYYKNVNKELENLVRKSDGIIIRAVSDIGWMAYKHAKKMNKPIAMEMAACAWDSTWNHGNKLGKIYAPIRYIRDKIIARNSHYVMYVSEFFLQKRYPTNGQTAHASNVRISITDEDIITKRISEVKYLEEVSHRPYVIGLIGNLNNKIKGVEDTLKALAIVEKKKPGYCTFRHLGPGDKKPFLKQAEELGLADIVYFDGMIKSGQGVLNWLDKIDLYLQPSYQEGIPRATIEAMSRGCPVIASKAGGLPELIEKKWLIKPGHIDQLADLILKMLDNPKERIEALIINYEKSHEYTNEYLSSRRKLFWGNFSIFIQNHKG